MRIAAHRADRAVAILYLKGVGQIRFEADGAAMASAGPRFACVRHRVSSCDPYRRFAVRPGGGAFKLTGQCEQQAFGAVAAAEHHAEGEAGGCG